MRKKKVEGTKTLDLHGMNYEEAELAVLNFILSEETPLKIITGNSERMRGVATKLIEEYSFCYYQQYWYNYGCLIVIDRDLF